MVSLLLLVTAILAALPGISCAPVKDTKCGCGSSLLKGIELDKSVSLTISSSSGVATRGYRLHLPRSYETIQIVLPILSFHGRGKDAKFQEELSQFSNATDCCSLQLHEPVPRLAELFPEWRHGENADV